MPVNAITLDAAGTLIFPRESVDSTYARIAEQHGGYLDSTKVYPAFSLALDTMPPMACPRQDQHRLHEWEFEWWRTLVRSVVEECGEVAAFDAFFDTLYRYYALPNEWALFKEVIPTVDAMRARGLRIAVLSNFDSRLEPILSFLGVTERVDSVVYSTEAGAAKPDPKIFQTVCQRLEVAADEVLHIGDNRTADYVGACAAGLHALWLSRNADTHLNVPYEHTINSLDAALVWLEDRK